MKWNLIAVFLFFLPSMQGHAGSAVEIPALLPETSAGDGAKAAFEAFRKNRPALACALATTAAESGSADAHFLLGFMMDSQKSGRVDQPQKSRLQSAIYHYRKAAEGGHREAKLRLTLNAMTMRKEKEREPLMAELVSMAGDPLVCRIIGESYARKEFMLDQPDGHKAEEWWKKAAEGGDAGSLYLLARLHNGDLGLPQVKNPSLALDYYRKAADRGVKESLVPLGNLLLQGDPSFRDETVGRDLLEKAAAGGDAGAWSALARYEEEVKKDVTSAIRYDTAGARAGDPGSLFRLGKRSMDDGRKDEAKDYFRRASEAGSAEASIDFAMLMLQDPSPDMLLVHRLLREAAEEGIVNGQYQLGLLYLDGKLGWTDPKAAVVWLTDAVMKAKDPEVHFRLASLHESGTGTPVNYANAGLLYTLASEKGHAGAAAAIARFAAEGLGTDISAIQAWAYATLAAERGDTSVGGLLPKIESKLDGPSKTEAEKVLAKLKGASTSQTRGGPK